MTPTHRCALLMLAFTFTAALPGCGNAPHGSFASAALGAVGLRKAAGLPESQQPPRNVQLRLHAATRLNVNASSNSAQRWVGVIRFSCAVS